MDYDANDLSKLPPSALAAALGRLAKGKSKRLTEEQRKAQADRLAVVREKRWK